jgi:hypothetical protein
MYQLQSTFSCPKTGEHSVSISEKTLKLAYEGIIRVPSIPLKA